MLLLFFLFTCTFTVLLSFLPQFHRYFGAPKPTPTLNLHTCQQYKTRNSQKKFVTGIYCQKKKTMKVLQTTRVAFQVFWSKTKSLYKEQSVTYCTFFICWKWSCSMNARSHISFKRYTQTLAWRNRSLNTQCHFTKLKAVVNGCTVSELDSEWRLWLLLGLFYPVFYVI